MKTTHLISSANQLTGFYIMGILVLNKFVFVHNADIYAYFFPTTIECCRSNFDSDFRVIRNRVLDSTK